MMWSTQFDKLNLNHRIKLTDSILLQHIKSTIIFCNYYTELIKLKNTFSLIDTVSFCWLVYFLPLSKQKLFLIKHFLNNCFGLPKLKCACINTFLSFLMLSRFKQSTHISKLLCISTRKNLPLPTEKYPSKIIFLKNNILSKKSILPIQTATWMSINWIFNWVNFNSTLYGQGSVFSDKSEVILKGHVFKLKQKRINYSFANYRFDVWMTLFKLLKLCENVTSSFVAFVENFVF